MSEEKPLTAQRRRAEALLQSFSIGPTYKLSYAEAVNAMQLFARSEVRQQHQVVTEMRGVIAQYRAHVRSPSVSVASSRLVLSIVDMLQGWLTALSYDHVAEVSRPSPEAAKEPT